MVSETFKSLIKVPFMNNLKYVLASITNSLVTHENDQYTVVILLNDLIIASNFSKSARHMELLTVNNYMMRSGVR